MTSRSSVRVREIPAHPFSVGRIITGDLHTSRPYSVTVRIGAIVRVRRFASMEAAIIGHAQACADVIILAEAASR